MTKPSAKSLPLGEVVMAALAINLVDGLLGMGHGGLTLAGMGWLGGLKGMVSMLALFTNTALLLVVSLVPAAPLRVFLPYFLAITWSAMLLLPLAIYVPMGLSLLLAALLQCLATIAVLVWHRRAYGSFRWTGECFGDGAVDWGYGVKFHLGLVLVLFFGVGGFLAWNANLFIQHHTDGYASLGWRGLAFDERVFVRDHDRVALMGTIHVADASFYEQAIDRFFDEGWIVLEEGVTDRERRFGGRYSYFMMADAFGLTPQSSGQRGGGTRYRADIDMSELSEDTMVLLSAVQLALEGKLWPYLQAIMALEEQGISVEEVIFADLVHKRNQRALQAMDKALDQEDRPVVLPWGALHMPGLEAGLLERGFVLENRRSHVAIGW